MVPLLGLQNALLGPPRPKQDNPGIQPLLGRKQQREGRQVGGGGQIQPAEAPLADQIVPHRLPPLRGLEGLPFRPVKLALVVEGQGQPPHALGGDPLVEPQPPEPPLRRLALAGRPGVRPEVPQLEVVPQPRVAGVPQRFVIDVQLCDPLRVVPGQDADAVHDGAPLRRVRVPLPLGLSPPPGQDAAAFLVHLPADAGAVGVVARRGQHDHRLLPPGGVGAGRQHVPQPAVGLGVELVDNNRAEGVAVLGGRVGGVHLEHAAVLGVDLLAGVHRPGNGVVLRLAQAGVLHHVLGRLVDLGGVFLVGGEHPHPRPLLAVVQQVIQAQAGRQFRLAVFLGQLVVEVAPVAHPQAVLVLHLNTVELPDGLLLPGEQLEGLARPLVLSEAQQGKEVQYVLYRLPAVAEHASVLRRWHLHPRCQGQPLRHAASAPASPASAARRRFPPGAAHSPAAPACTGW